MITIYIAVDIGKRNCVVCITDKDGSILEETKYENTLQEAGFASHLNKKYSNRKCLLFTGITPLFLGPLISIDSDSSTSALGVLITIGGLTLVALGIASLIVSWGLLKGKGWSRTITLIISIIAIIFAIVSLISSEDLVHIISVIIYGIIIYYLFTKKVKLFFGKAKEPTT